MMSTLGGADVNDFRQETVKILSRTAGWFLDAWVFTPGRRWQQPYPVIVMAHGLTANKTMWLDKYGPKFAAHGYACVVFDYRRWGTSDGTPRDSIFVSEQLDDYRTVINYCRKQVQFNPHKVVVWGTSFSGGHAITLAAERRLNLSAVIAQCLYLGGGSSAPLDLVVIKTMIYVLWDMLKQALGGSPVYIPGVSRPGTVAALNVEGAVEAFFRSGGRYSNQVSASSIFEIPFYNPSTTSPSISTPTLVVPAEGDLVCAWKDSTVTNGQNPNIKTISIPGDHFTVYPGEPGHDAAFKAQLEFLQEHVPV